MRLLFALLAAGPMLSFSLPHASAAENLHDTARRVEINRLNAMNNTWKAGLVDRFRGTPIGYAPSVASSAYVRHPCEPSLDHWQRFGLPVEPWFAGRRGLFSASSASPISPSSSPLHSAKSSKSHRSQELRCRIRSMRRRRGRTARRLSTIFGIRATADVGPERPSADRVSSARTSVTLMRRRLLGIRGGGGCQRQALHFYQWLGDGTALGAGATLA